MSLERKTDPLPPGRYWLDVIERPPGQIQAFQEWASGGLVTVESTEEHEPLGDVPRRLFVIFRVKEPGAVFSAEKFGFPNHAPESVKTEKDTADAPDVPEDFSEQLEKALSSGGLLVGVAVGILFAMSVKTALEFLSKAKGPKI